MACNASSRHWGNFQVIRLIIAIISLCIKIFAFRELSSGQHKNKTISLYINISYCFIFGFYLIFNDVTNQGVIENCRTISIFPQ